MEVAARLLRGWGLPSAGGGGKDDRGRVLVAAGSAETPGAVLLAGLAALRVGAGKLAVATAAEVAPALGVALPEALVRALPTTAAGAVAAAAGPAVAGMAAAADAVLVGPGAADEDATAAVVAAAVGAAAGAGAAVVLDALALVALERDPGLLARLGGRAVLTPNPKELGLLLGRDVDPDSRIEAAAEAAHRFGAVVSLGGEESVVAAPSGETWRDCTGGAGLGVSGSGDAAAGVVTGLLARGAPPARAAVWAAHLHGRAGERCAARTGAVGFLAREVVDELPAVLAAYG